MSEDNKEQITNLSTTEKQAKSGLFVIFWPHRGIFFWSFFSILIFAVLFAPYQQVVEVQIRQEQVLGQTVQSLPVVADYRPKLKNSEIVFNSNAVIAYATDLKTGTILYEKNPDQLWPTASLAKLMTALVVVNTVPVDAIIEVSDRALDVPQPVMGLVAGEKITVYDLLRGMLIMSANDAANALAIGVAGSIPRFVELMNSLAEKLELTQTHFRNPAGFDDPAQYSSAKDLDRLAREFLSDPKLAVIVQTQSVSVSSVDRAVRHWLKTSNKLLSNPGILGVKTGYTDSARGNLIVLAQDEFGHQILTVVLGSTNRESDSQALISWVFQAFNFPD